MTIQANIAAYSDALAAVSEHCMAASVERASGKVIVLYPAGYYPDGVRTDDSAEGLRRILPVMERHRLESFPGDNGMDGAK